MLENLTREQLLSILQEIVRYCTVIDKYHMENNEKIEKELESYPDEDTFQELLRNRSWNNGSLGTTEEIFRTVKVFSDIYNEYNEDN